MMKNFSKSLSMHFTNPRLPPLSLKQTHRTLAVVCGCVPARGRLPAPARVFISLDLMTANGYASNKTLPPPPFLSAASLLDKWITPPLHLTPGPPAWRWSRLHLQFMSGNAEGHRSEARWVNPTERWPRCTAWKPAARSKTSHLPRNVFAELSAEQSELFIPAAVAPSCQRMALRSHRGRAQACCSLAG